MKTPAPGIYYGMPIETYHSFGDVISKSGLDDIARSPAIYKALRSPGAPARSEKAGQLEGNLCHAATLEPDEFAKRYVVGPDIRRGTKIWDAFEAEHPGKTVVKPDQYEVAMAQAKSLRGNPQLADAFKNGFAEASIFWVDAETGMLCRCRPDWTHVLSDGSIVLIDLKTYSDSSPREFKKQISRKRYACQDAMYSEGVAKCMNVEVRAFLFAAVSTEYPFASSLCMLDDASKEAGNRQFRRDLGVYAECMRAGVWPGYGDSIEIISMNKWEIEEI